MKPIYVQIIFLLEIIFLDKKKVFSFNLFVFNWFESTFKWFSFWISKKTFWKKNQLKSICVQLIRIYCQVIPLLNIKGNLLIRNMFPLELYLFSIYLNLCSIFCPFWYQRKPFNKKKAFNWYPLIFNSFGSTFNWFPF